VITNVSNGAGYGLGSGMLGGLLSSVGSLGFGGGGYGASGGYASPAGYADSGASTAIPALATSADPTPMVDSAVQPALATAPAALQSTAHVDLVLEDVSLIQPATLVAGPAYRVQFRNQGSEAAGKFSVGILALIDDLAPTQAPHALVEVPGLAAGEVTTVTLRLPQSATRLVSVSHSKPTMFSKLAVAVDVDNQVPETDKSNNGVVIDRTTLESVVK
jgi:hypothetical protein